MNDKIADITFTSPPYNAGKTPTESKMQKQQNTMEMTTIKLLSNI